MVFSYFAKVFWLVAIALICGC